MKLVKKKEFAAVTLDLNDKVFVIYIAFFASFDLDIEFYSFYKVQITLLIVNIISITGPSKYINFADIFFF